MIDFECVSISAGFLQFLNLQVSPDKCLSIILKNFNLRTERWSFNAQCVAPTLARRLMLRITSKTNIFLGVSSMIVNFVALLLTEGTNYINMLWIVPWSNKLSVWLRTLLTRLVLTLPILQIVILMSKLHHSREWCQTNVGSVQIAGRELHREPILRSTLKLSTWICTFRVIFVVWLSKQGTIGSAISEKPMEFLQNELTNSRIFQRLSCGVWTEGMSVFCVAKWSNITTLRGTSKTFIPVMVSLLCVMSARNILKTKIA